MFETPTREKEQFLGNQQIGLYSQTGSSSTVSKNVPLFNIAKDLTGLEPIQTEPVLFPSIGSSAINIATRPDFPLTQNVRLEVCGQSESSSLPQNVSDVFVRKENLDSNKPDYFDQSKEFPPRKPEPTIDRRPYLYNKTNLKTGSLEI